MPENEELSLREQLQAAYDQHSQDEEEEKQSAAAASHEEVTPPAAETQESRQRDETGKFKAKDTQQAEVPAQQDVESANTESAEPAAEKQANETEAPASWNAEARAKWKDLPPDVQSYIQHRETSMQQMVGRMDAERQVGRTMQMALRPFEQTMQQLGVDPVTATTKLFEADHALRYGSPEQKVQMLHQIMHDYGINAEAAFQYQPQPVDPAVQAMQQRVQFLEQALTSGQRQTQLQQQAELQAQVESFAAQNQHFDKVRDHMAAILQSGLAKDMQDAYDQAVWARPDLRQSLLSQREAEQKAVAQQAASQKAAQSRIAGSSVAGTPAGVTPVPPPENRSLREELQAQFAAAQGRV